MKTLTELESRKPAMTVNLVCPAKNSHAIVQEALERFGSAWEAIASQIVPSSRRRGGGPQDVVQEVLKQLYAALCEPECNFKSSTEVFLWTKQVARFKAMKLFTKETSRGLRATVSEITPPGGDGEAAEPNEHLAEILSLTACLPAADLQCVEAEVQRDFELLSKLVDDTIKALENEDDRKILIAWLALKGIHAIAAEVDVSDYDVRQTTLHFETDPEIRALVAQLRADLIFLEAAAPGVVGRLQLQHPARRLLATRPRTKRHGKR